MIDLLATPPPTTANARELDDEKAAQKGNHESVAKQVVVPADIASSRHKEVWFQALSWQHSGVRNPKSNKNLKLTNSMELSVWHRARADLKKKRDALKKKKERHNKKKKKKVEDPPALGAFAPCLPVPVTVGSPDDPCRASWPIVGLRSGPEE